MRKKIINLLLATSLVITLTACGGGGGSSGSGSAFIDDPVPPSPSPASGTYEGKLYSELGQPTGLSNYPQAFLPNNLQSNSLQIAYGHESQTQVKNLTAYVTMGNHICSATPVKYDAYSDTTFLIGAAHCFVNNKTSATTLNASNLMPITQLSIKHGVSLLKGGFTSYPVKAVYVREDYCHNATFSGISDCPNFTPNIGTSNGQGNDIAVIQVQGEYADSESYPQVVPASEYPTPYTMAPVLSIGYGLNTQQPTDADSLPFGEMFYVANYQYWQQDSTPLNSGGYHYLYNSFYNNGGPGQTGYTSLICGGDSGGGDLFWTGSKWILLSEHTYGSLGCGIFYSVLLNGATNVSAYYDWIQAIFTSKSPVESCKNGTIPNCVTNGS